MLINDEEYEFLKCICNVIQREESSSQEIASTISYSLIKFFSKIQLSLPFMKWCVSNEIHSKPPETVLFRGNTPATKLLTSFYYVECRDYFNAVIKPHIIRLIELSPAITRIKDDEGSPSSVSYNKRPDAYSDSSSNGDSACGGGGVGGCGGGDDGNRSDVCHNSSDSNTGGIAIVSPLISTATEDNDIEINNNIKKSKSLLNDSIDTFKLNKKKSESNAVASSSSAVAAIAAAVASDGGVASSSSSSSDNSSESGAKVSFGYSPLSKLDINNSRTNLYNGIEDDGLARFMSELDLLVGDFLSSLHKFPLSVRRLTKYAKSETSRKYRTSNNNNIVNTFVFHKFLVPVISVPEFYADIPDDVITPAARRALMIASALVQWLADGADIDLSGQIPRIALDILRSHRGSEINRYYAEFCAVEDIDTESGKGGGGDNNGNESNGVNGNEVEKKRKGSNSVHFGLSFPTKFVSPNNVYSLYKRLYIHRSAVMRAVHGKPFETRISEILESFQVDTSKSPSHSSSPPARAFASSTRATNKPDNDAIVNNTIINKNNNNNSNNVKDINKNVLSNNNEGSKKSKSSSSSRSSDGSDGTDSENGNDNNNDGNATATITSLEQAAYEHLEAAAKALSSLTGIRSGLESKMRREYEARISKMEAEHREEVRALRFRCDQLSQSALLDDVTVQDPVVANALAMDPSSADNETLRRMFGVLQRRCIFLERQFQLQQQQQPQQQQQRSRKHVLESKDVGDDTGHKTAVVTPQKAQNSIKANTPRMPAVRNPQSSPTDSDKNVASSSAAAVSGAAGVSGSAAAVMQGGGGLMKRQPKKKPSQQIQIQQQPYPNMDMLSSPSGKHSLAPQPTNTNSRPPLTRSLSLRALRGKDDVNESDISDIDSESTHSDGSESGKFEFVRMSAFERRDFMDRNVGVRTQNEYTKSKDDKPSVGVFASESGVCAGGSAAATTKEKDRDKIKGLSKIKKFGSHLTPPKEWRKEKDKDKEKEKEKDKEKDKERDKEKEKEKEKEREKEREKEKEKERDKDKEKEREKEKEKEKDKIKREKRAKSKSLKKNSPITMMISIHHHQPEDDNGNNNESGNSSKNNDSLHSLQKKQHTEQSQPSSSSSILSNSNAVIMK